MGGKQRSEPSTQDSMQALIDQLSDPVLGLFQNARALISSLHPEVVEVAWPHQKTAGFGVGPKKMSEQYAYVTLHTSHLNLGFYYGADLDDPSGVLGGEGKSMRSTRIAKPSDLERPALRQLLKLARHHLPRLKQ